MSVKEAVILFVPTLTADVEISGTLNALERTYPQVSSVSVSRNMLNKAGVDV